MIHIKLFEELNSIDYSRNIPEIGDYVMANTTYASEKLQDFFSTHIGQISRIEDVSKSSKLELYIQVYYNYSKDLNGKLYDNCWSFTYRDLSKKSEILYWSKDKKDFDFIINAKKYNL